MKKVVYIFLLLVIPLSLNAYSFSRTLQVGSEGQDVLELQKYLNSNSQTQAGFEGAGSPGQETTYFGEKTKQGVIKLQNLYASAILYPVGLTFGTGFVGNSTINFLNAHQPNTTSVISQTNSVSPTYNTQPTLTPSITNTSSQTAIVESVSPEKFYSGDTVTVIGKNFSPTNNTLILGFEARDAYTNIPSTDNGTKIEFKLISSIQEVYNDKYSKLPKSSQKIVKEKFPEIPVAVSVIGDNREQSNFKIINFNLK